jgi:hypothetical protein
MFAGMVVAEFMLADGPNPPGQSSALSVLRSKKHFYGAFACARGALTSVKRRFPARAEGAGDGGVAVVQVSLCHGAVYLM